jgi:hypothetical protein
MVEANGFGGLVVSMLASGAQDRGFGFFGRKNPQHAFLRRGSKAACPMSQICGMLKSPVIYVERLWRWRAELTAAHRGSAAYKPRWKGMVATRPRPQSVVEASASRRRPVVLCLGLPLFCLANSMTVPWSRPLPLASKPFPIYDSLLSYTWYCVLLRSSESP